LNRLRACQEGDDRQGSDEPSSAGKSQVNSRCIVRCDRTALFAKSDFGRSAPAGTLRTFHVMRISPLLLIALLAGCGSSGAPASPAGGAGGTAGMSSDRGAGGAGAGGSVDAGVPGKTPADAAATVTVDAMVVPAEAAVADRSAEVDAVDSAGDAMASFVLTSGGLLMKDGRLVFPASASYPMDHSPPFEWSGAPAGTQSFALTFVDKSNGATKWVVWNIPATRTGLPGDLSKEVHPAQVPEASQRGSLNRIGYSGPGVPGPPLHEYELIVYALDVRELQGTDGLSTIQLRTATLPKHTVARTAPLIAYGQEGGP
jgi:Raf kinase inhibitor-like YbhB/YbcL family protein